MNKYTIKYSIAVATLVATAFCGCGSSDEEIIYTDRSITVAEDSGDPASLTVREETASDEKKEIRIYVCGAVNKPGVYTLKNDDRIVDAVSAAGGFTDDAGCDYLNLASVLSDGQKVYVPTRKEVEAAIAAGDDPVTAKVNITADNLDLGLSEGNNVATNTVNNNDGGDRLVNINTADAATLMTLPGIGQSKADKIIAYREANGAFSRVEDIMLVGGIKEGLFNKVKDRICVR